MNVLTRNNCWRWS